MFPEYADYPTCWDSMRVGSNVKCGIGVPGFPQPGVVDLARFARLTSVGKLAISWFRQLTCRVKSLS